MMIKKVAARVHALILQKKWNMNPAGAILLGGVQTGLYTA